MTIRLMRVLTRLGAGGPPIHCLTVERGLRARGYESTLVTGELGADDGDMSYLLREDDRLDRLRLLGPAASPLRDLAALIALTLRMRRDRPQIVHTHTAKAGVIGRLAAKLAGVPAIVHTLHGNVLSGYFPGPVNWAIRAVERALARWTDAICVLSPSQAGDIAQTHRIAPEDRVVVVPLGMNLAPFAHLEPAPVRAPCDPFVIAWMGRMVPVKDLPLLRSVIEAVIARLPEVRFLIAGDGPERALLDGLPRANVRLLGWLADVRPVIERSHLTILTSKNEGTPVALIQSMAAGRPFVSTAAGGVKDLAGEGLPVDQMRGALVAPSAAAFADSIVALAHDEARRRSMGRRAAEFALATFGEARLLADLDALYRSLLREKGVAIDEVRPAAVARRGQA